MAADTAKPLILLVEDDAVLAEVVRDSLDRGGYRVVHAKEANAAMQAMAKGAVALALFDINLPGISGLELLKIIKARPETAGLPVIMITVLGDESHKVQALTTGADDYLPKPFSTKELLARIESVLRRVRRTDAPRKALESGDVRVDVETREVTAGGKPVVLTAAEFRILSLFLRRRGFALSYASIAEAIGEGNKDVSPSSVQTHVKNLRQKLGPAGAAIATVHGMGYKFEP